MDPSLDRGHRRTGTRSLREARSQEVDTLPLQLLKVSPNNPSNTFYYGHSGNLLYMDENTRNKITYRYNYFLNQRPLPFGEVTVLVSLIK